MQIYHQSVFDKWPIEDCSIQALITSPPYYSLRKYSIPDVIIGGKKDCWHKSSNDYWLDNGKCMACDAWQGQHGLEPSYRLFISHCKLWMQEAIRVLRDDGIIFVNLADSYNGSGGQGNQHKQAKVFGNFNPHKDKNYPDKSKLLIPERFAIMCVDELGLILRNHIVWYKPNAMPESCQDRFSKKWESIFMFTKQEKYYFNLDDVREPHAQVSIERLQRSVSNNQGELIKSDSPEPFLLNFSSDVWNIPTQPSGKFKGLGDYEGSDGKTYKASLDCPIYEHRLCAEKKQREQYDEQLNSSLNHISDNAIHPAQGLETESVSIHSHDVAQIKNEHFFEPKVHNMENRKISDEGEANSQNLHHNKRKNEKHASNLDSAAQKDSEIAIYHNKKTHKKAPEPLTNQTYISSSEKVDDIGGKQVEHEIAEHTSRIDENNILEVSSLNEKGINVEVEIPSGILNISHINNNIAKCTCQQISDAHFAMWPEKLVERMILCSTRPGDTVLDCFCGSCTTGRVAIQHNRKFIGIDLGYGDIQQRRTKNI